MRRAVRMLLWELWARNRSLNIWILLSLPAWIAGVRFYPEREGHGLAVQAFLNIARAVLLVFPLLLYVVYPVAVISRAQEQWERRRLGLPERLCTLPLPTWLIVTVHMTVCILVMGFVSLILAWLVHDFRAYGWWWSFVIVTGGACFLALNWSLAARPILCVVTMYAVGAVLVASAVVPAEGHGPAWLITVFALVPPVLFLLAWVFAIKGVSADRRSSIRCVPRLTELTLRLLDRFAGTPHRFRSPTQAQVWIESRWIWPVTLAPLLLQVIIVLVASGVALYTGTRVPVEAVVATAYIPLAFIAPLLALMLGALLLQGHAHNGGAAAFSLEINPFQATLPLSDMTSAYLKLRAGMKCLATMVGACVLFSLFFLVAATGLSGIRGVIAGMAPVHTGQLLLWGGIAIVLYAVLLWTLMSWSLTILLTNSRAIILPAAIFGSVGAFLYAMVPAVGDMEEFRGYVLIMRVIAVVLLCGLLLLSTFVIRVGLRKRLLSGRLLASAAAGWGAILTAVCVAAVSQFASSVGWPAWPEVAALGLFVAAVLPIAPLAAAPLAFHRARHQR